MKITAVEDAILSALRSDAALAASVRLFTPVPSLAEEELERLIVLFPAIGVVSLSGDYTYEMSGVQDETGLFSVLCFARNLRSALAAVRGDATGEPGVWDLVDDCRRVLFAGLPGSGVSDCMPIRRRLIEADDPFAIAALEVEVRWRN